MEKEIAQKIMLSLEALGEALNELAADIEKIKDIEEKKKYRRGVGELMTRSYTDIMRHIIREYPELDPDKDSDWHKEMQKKRINKNTTRDKIKSIEEKALKKMREKLPDDVA
jgi:hypothetical protein